MKLFISAVLMCITVPFAVHVLPPPQPCWVIINWLVIAFFCAVGMFAVYEELK